ncbi:MAG: extracellular solute-binding protein [Rhabdochlamydiaceae bacterium]|nr:extracellular solute-binding protein [Rhabdochlamydiaceae bacterium]
MKKILTLVFFAITLSLKAEKKEIVLWHAFEGFIAEKFAEIVEDFNHQSASCRVVLLNKGNYTEIYNKGLEAFAQGHPPHILQVYEVATQSMMLKTEVFRPVDLLMKQFFKKFDSDVYIDAVRDFYSTPDKKMYSLPWNASTGILFYNKKAFEKAGLDPNSPPVTWEQLESMGRKLVNAGYKGFVTAWPAAYNLEYLCSWHNLPFATYENGIGGLEARLSFNGPYQIRHLEKLTSWQKENIFQYEGRYTSEPEKMFMDGKSAILLQGSNRFAMLKKGAKDPIGVGFVPYWADIPGSPFRLTIGGSSFWAMEGFDEETYRGIAQFFAYLSLAEVQAYWHQQTGYLPITEAAYYLSKKKGFYEQNPAAEIAVLEVMNQKITPYTKGIRLGNYPIIREKILDYMEQALEGRLTAKEALDRAVEEGNLILSQFELEHSIPKKSSIP